MRRAPGLSYRCAAAGSPCAAGRREFGPEKADAGAALCARHKALNTRLLLLCGASRPPAPRRLCTALPKPQSRSYSRGASRARWPERFKATRRVAALATGLQSLHQPRVLNPPRLRPLGGGREGDFRRTFQSCGRLSLDLKGGGRGSILHAARRLRAIDYQCPE